MAGVVIEKRTRVDIESAWTSWLSTDGSDYPYTNTDLVEFKSVANVDYIPEYVAAYEQLVASSLESFGSGKDSILEKQLQLLEEGKDHITQKEKLSLTYQAYGSIRNSIMVNSQKTAMALVDSKYKFDGDLAQQALQVGQMEEQLRKAVADTAYVVAQKEALYISLKDNTMIKALDSLGDTFGTFGAGGITLSSDMWNTYFSIVAQLVEELGAYKGEWDAGTNTPDITTMTLDQGDFYKVSVAGSTDAGGTTSWVVGDLVFFNGDRLERSTVGLPSSTTVTKVV